MSKALRSAFDMYTKLNVGGFVGGDSRMNSNQFTKMCTDAGMMEPNGGRGALQGSGAAGRGWTGWEEREVGCACGIAGAMGGGDALSQLPTSGRMRCMEASGGGANPCPPCCGSPAPPATQHTQARPVCPRCS